MIGDPTIGQGLAFPFSTTTHGPIRMTTGVTDVEEAIWIILGTAPGERVMRPEFGCDIYGLLFERVDATLAANIRQAVERALDRYEPRIVVDAVDVAANPFDEGGLDIRVAYRIRHQPGSRNLVFPFYVIPTEGPR